MLLPSLPLRLSLLVFVICAMAIWIAGTSLSNYTDVLSDRLRRLPPLRTDAGDGRRASPPGCAGGASAGRSRPGLFDGRVRGGLSVSVGW